MQQSSPMFLAVLALVFLALSGSTVGAVYMIFGVSGVRRAADLDESEVPQAGDLQTVRLDQSGGLFEDPLVLAGIGGGVVFAGAGAGALALFALRDAVARPKS